MDFTRLQTLVNAVVGSEGLAGEAEIAQRQQALHGFLFGQITADIRKRKFKRGAEVWRILEQGAPLIALSKAQLFQDIWVLFELDQKRAGFFVEFGAASGVSLSNTWMLEKHFGWAGILAEPNPEFHESLKANRSCQISFDCVYRTTGETVPFYCASIGELSGLVSARPEGGSDPEAAQVIQVPTVSLQDLLRRQGAPQVIDYMSIDTEGSEYDILSAFDFDAWNVRTLSVEHNRKPQRTQIFDLLTRNGYVRKFPELSLFDDWYVRER
jgi:FkbM family methyltransferase